MNDRAESRDPAEAAAQAVKAYIRMHREKLAEDGELLGLLLPQRFGDARVRDMQSYVIERLAGENAALRAERDGLRSDRSVRLGDGVRKLVLDLIDARSFEEAIAVATAAAPAFGADRVALCATRMVPRFVRRSVPPPKLLVPTGAKVPALSNVSALSVRSIRPATLPPLWTAIAAPGVVESTSKERRPCTSASPLCGVGPGAPGSIALTR